MMPRWPLSLPPPAAPTSTSLSRRSSSSIAIELPSCHPSTLSCRCAVHHHQVAIMPYIVVHHCFACVPLPLRSCRSSSSIPIKSPLSGPLPSIAIESIAVECPLRRRSPSIAVHRPLPSMSRSSWFFAINCPPSHHPSPLSPSPFSHHRAVHCCPLPSTVHRH